MPLATISAVRYVEKVEDRPVMLTSLMKVATCHVIIAAIVGIYKTT